jgi:hypothetical protein
MGEELDTLATGWKMLRSALEGEVRLRTTTQRKFEIGENGGFPDQAHHDAVMTDICACIDDAAEKRSRLAPLP